MKLKSSKKTVRVIWNGFELKWRCGREKHDENGKKLKIRANVAATQHAR